ncbi:MAG: T9SS type A sorting domain-containing protein [Bacteroidales bacterium]|nr:T9SS type A sorting domain-containing protein [Bacteroidales bacterium]MCF8404519.1 T9SS type A sorting domain-containing protein [Bacteroidales bacterium]
MNKIIIALSFIALAVNPIFSQGFELQQKTKITAKKSNIKLQKSIIFSDDFETYSANAQLICQNPNDWTTWDTLPCTYQDAYIIDSLAWSGTNSVIITDSNDIVKPIDNYTEARYKISFNMYVPEGNYGYFNTLQKFYSPNSNFGMQVFFEDNGNAFLGMVGTTFFNYEPNRWFSNIIIVDLDNDHAQYFHNNILIDEWKWSLGGGFSGINQLAGSNFYAWDNLGQGTGKYFIDDYQIEQLEPMELLPPESLTIEYFYPDNVLNWNSPYAEELIHWDVGNYGNGIGPGTLYAAARFDTTDLQNLDGMYLTKIRFFAQTNNCSYSLRVWMGETAATLLLEQDILEFEAESWNDIELDNPILIDASQELWIGNVCSGPSYPAACDDGPAAPYKGDLISFDGINWSSLSLEWGLDYNWNIRGILSDISDKGLVNEIVLSSVSKYPTGDVINADNKFNFSDQKSLQGYNIYQSYNENPYDLLDFTYDTNYLHEAPLAGVYGYYVTALYDEGESTSSDTVYMLLDNLNRLEIELINIYPNPVKNILSIQSQQNIRKISLSNMAGKSIAEFSELNKLQFDFPVRDYKKGIYLIRIESGNEIVFRKIIIQ